MENFDDFFTEAFETATLKGKLVTLKGVRENAPGAASAETSSQPSRVPATSWPSIFLGFPKRTFST